MKQAKRFKVKRRFIKEVYQIDNMKHGKIYMQTFYLDKPKEFDEFGSLIRNFSSSDFDRLVKKSKS